MVMRKIHKKLKCTGGRKVDYYKKTNRFTRITKHNWIISQLRQDNEFLFAVVKSILIHPMDANEAKVKYDKKNNGIFHCFNSKVDTILEYSLLEKYLEERRIPLSTPPSDRAVLSCDHHSLLFVSFLRNLGIAARARTGYCTYIVEGQLIPHWIAEVYDEENKKWIIIDSDRQLQNVDRSGFIFAAEAWKQHKFNSCHFPNYSGFSGTQGLKYALLCDLNCIFKNELLSDEWRLSSHNRKKPSIVRATYENLTEEQQGDINNIAELMINPDDNLNELWQIYSRIVESCDLQESGFRI